VVEAIVGERYNKKLRPEEFEFKWAGHAQISWEPASEAPPSAKLAWENDGGVTQRESSFYRQKEKKKATRIRRVESAKESVRRRSSIFGSGVLGASMYAAS